MLDSFLRTDKRIIDPIERVISFFFTFTRPVGLGASLFFRETIRLDSRWIEPFFRRRALSPSMVITVKRPPILALQTPRHPLSLILSSRSSLRESFLPFFLLPRSSPITLSLSLSPPMCEPRKGDPVGKIMALRVKSRMHIKRYYFAR